jgi:Zn ribbon nucleic-acid-binding protein
MLQTKKFKKKQEDFTCENCGQEVKGNGYTNHCPACLWSKHVDINPGDRASECQGMMQPIRIEMEKQEYILTNECVKCGHIKRNKLAPDDDFDVATQIAQRTGKRGE